MVFIENKGYLPDFLSRYFVEDFPFGLSYKYELCLSNNINMPNINMVYN